MPIYKMNGKKDGKQQYRVRINYTDSLGKARQLDRVAYGSAEAKALELKLKQELKEKVISRRLTVQNLFEEYIEAKKQDVRETTLRLSERILKAYVLPIVGNLDVNKLTNPVLQKWKTEISEKELSTLSKQNIYGEFRAMLNYAVKMEYLPKNPLLIIGNFRDPYFEVKQEKIQFYTPEQFKQYIAAARKNATNLTEWGYYVFFAIAYYTGMRKGEINALKWSDIENDTIKVRRSISQKLKGKDRETPPKNKSSCRDIQMPIPLIQILDEHKKRQQKIEGFTENFRICGGISCLRDTSLANKNIQFAKEAGLPHIRIHDFRHSHASLLANEGINIQEIARRLGHSKIEITWNTYSHLYPREEERALKILNKIV